MSYNYDQVKQQFEPLSQEQRDQFMRQNANDANFKDFATRYTEELQGRTPQQSPSPAPVQQTQPEQVHQIQNNKNGVNAETSPPQQTVQVQDQNTYQGMSDQIRTHKFGYETSEDYRKQRDSAFAQQLYQINPNWFDYESVYKYVKSQAQNVSAPEITSTVHNIQRQYLQHARLGMMRTASAEQIRNWILNGKLSQSDLEILKVQNPEKYQEYLAYDEKMNAMSNAKHNAEALHNLYSDKSVKKEKETTEILLETVSKIFGNINYNKDFINQYKEAINAPEIQKRKSKMLEAQKEMDQIDDDLDTMRKDIAEQYPWISKTQLNQILYDRSFKSLRRKNELHRDFTQARGEVQFAMDIAGKNLEADLKGVELERLEFSDKIKALWFAQEILSFETPQQKRDAELEHIKKKAELEAELTDINSSDPKIQQNAVMRALDPYFKEFGSIILRPQAQVAQDIIAQAKRERISVGEAMRKNFTEPLQGKSEYKMLMNRQYWISNEPIKDSIGSYNGQNYIMSYDENGNLKLSQPLVNQTLSPQIGSGMKGAGLRNNNPWNIKDQNFGNPIGVDHKGFAQFTTPEDWFDALVEKIKYNQTNPSSRYYGKTIAQYFKLYAPDSDGNNSTAYANSVAKQLWVNVNTPISQLDPVQFAKHIAKHDSGYNHVTYGQFRNTSWTSSFFQTATSQEIEDTKNVYEALMRIYPINPDGSYKEGFSWAIGWSWNKLAGKVVGGESGLISWTAAASYKKNLDNFISLQILPNLGKLKGALSDKDIQFLKDSASPLGVDMSEKEFINNINGIKRKLEEKLWIQSTFDLGYEVLSQYYSSESIATNKTTDELADLPF